jgi:hypothetical protein
MLVTITIAEINESQSSSLAEPDEPESGRFTWHLLVLPDTYLSPGQVVCFQEMMKIIHNGEVDDKKSMSVSTSQCSFDRILVNMSPDHMVRVN